MTARARARARKPKLRTYTVEVRRAQVSSITFQVAATDEEDASARAHEQLEDQDPDDWEYIDEETEVTDVVLDQVKFKRRKS